LPVDIDSLLRAWTQYEGEKVGAPFTVLFVGKLDDRQICEILNGVPLVASLRRGGALRHEHGDHHGGRRPVISFDERSRHLHVEVSQVAIEALLCLPTLADGLRDVRLALTLAVLNAALVSALKGFSDDPVAGPIAGEKALERLLRIGCLLSVAKLAEKRKEKAAQ
jgi:hypothetical protein